jgi:nucleotide-binding universal stress UspA family protein
MHLAVLLEGRLDILHVMPKSELFAPVIGDIKEKTKERLEGLKERFETEGIKSVSVRIATGEAFEEITGLAEAMEMSLVVIASGRPGSGGKPRLGATAEKVIRHCKRPVWVVRPGDSARIVKILCPVDMSDHSARALRNAIRLAHKLHGSLHVVHVVRSLSSIHPYIEGVLADGGLEEMHYKERKRAFKELLKTFDFGDIEWRQSVLRGDAGKEIVKQAAQDRSQLIVMGSEGRTGISRWLMGSVAAKVARALPCSLLMVKEVDAIKAKHKADLEKVLSCYERGQELLGNGRPEDAIEQFKTCLTHNELFVGVWLGLANAHDEIGDSEAADRYREIARKMSTS